MPVSNDIFDFSDHYMVYLGNRDCARGVYEHLLTAKGGVSFHFQLYENTVSFLGTSTSDFFKMSCLLGCIVR